jgi:16S rRNA (cytosine1402-N4)-methyltransferase
MLEESIHGLKVEAGGRYVDCTTGAGGHAQAILDASSPGGQLLGFEADPQAVEIARERLTSFGSSALIVNRNFSNLEEECLERNFFPLNGVLFDLGLPPCNWKKPAGGSVSNMMLRWICVSVRISNSA